MCWGSRCGVVTLATFGGEVTGGGNEPLGIDATHVYFWAGYGPPGGDVAIARVPKAGGTVAPLLKTNAAGGVYEFPGRFAFDDTTFYFPDSQGLEAMPKTGGTPITLAKIDTSKGLAGGDMILVGNAFDLGGQSGISSVPKAGGVPTVVVQDPKIFGYTHDATAYYWLTCDFQLKRQTPGGVPTVIAQYTPTGNCPLSFDASDTELFFGGDYDGLLHQAGKDGTKRADTKGKYGAQNHLAHNATTLFWEEGESTMLRARPIAGGEPVDLTAVVAVTAIVADEDAVYWSESYAQNQGAIRKMVLPKK